MNSNNLIYSGLAAVAGGILLGISWIEITPWAFLIFGALVSLFFLADKCRENLRCIFLFSFATFLLWHLIAAYWMIFSTVLGSVTAWMVNSFLMAGVVSLSVFSKSKIKWLPPEIILSIYWLSFEIMHLYWDLMWPWMTLGNVFANRVEWIQWYEFSGVYGGTFWVIAANGLAFRFIKSLYLKKFRSGLVWFVMAALLILIPVVFSKSLLNSETQPTEMISVSVVQPNIDTYREKFGALSPLAQSEKLVQQMQNDHSSNIYILPETAIPESFDPEQLPFPASIELVMHHSQTTQTTIVGGFYTHHNQHHYNSALVIENGKIVACRNKIKLLPFAESVPFGRCSGKLERFIEAQGGLGFSYERDSVARVLTLNGHKIGVFICFESVFQDFGAEMTQNGAELLLVITNDDWWHDTPGHRQHFALSRLRAIENRRSIARAANTGISGFIDSYGRVMKASEYKETCILSAEIIINPEKTFFTKHEPVLRWSILGLAGGLLLFVLVGGISRKNE